MISKKTKCRVYNIPIRRYTTHNRNVSMERVASIL